jgi:hypothetical protein
MFVISLGQAGISYTMAFGALSAVLPRDRSGIATFLVILRFGLAALMAVLWALRWKHALFQLIVIANALFTLALLMQTISLISALFGGAPEAVIALMLDVVLMATSNIPIFSVWYWASILRRSKTFRAPTGRGISSSPNEAAPCHTMKTGFLSTRTICSLPSRPALRSARPTLCLLPDAPRY